MMVTLIDGTAVDGASEEWRAECLKRHGQAVAVCGMLGKSRRAERDQFCRTVGAREGAEAEKRLRALISKMWPKGVEK